MRCLSPIEELYPRVACLPMPRGKRLDLLPEASARDLRRLPGPLRSRLPGARAWQRIRQKIWHARKGIIVNSATTIEKSEERLERSKSTLEPGSPGQVRRTRGVAPANRRETPKPKSNGHDAGATRESAHGLASPSRTALDIRAPLKPGRAASDDTRDFPAAAAASSAVAGKERDVCAEVAPPSEGAMLVRPEAGEQQAGTGTPRVPSEDDDMKKQDRDKNAEQNSGEAQTVDIPPGSEPLPEDGPGFVDVMHEHVDLYLACARLVKSKDEKIAQRMMERLLEMSYGKSPSANSDEIPQIIFDAPRPIRD